MKTFTIDADNNISAFASKKEAAAASATPFDPFTSQEELAELAADWPMSRLVEIWNSIPGGVAVTKFTNRKVGTERIWKAIQNLGATPKPTAEASEPLVVVELAPAEPAPVAEVPAAIPEVEQVEVVAQPTIELPEADTNAAPAPDETGPTVEAQVTDAAPAVAHPVPKLAREKKAKAAKKAAEPKAAGVRDGSKTAQVIALLKRPAGATLEEIMAQMGWQKHTVRGFMAGTMKKAGHTVESFKSEKGERTYRINQ